MGEYRPQWPRKSRIFIGCPFSTRVALVGFINDVEWYSRPPWMRGDRRRRIRQASAAVRASDGFAYIVLVAEHVLEHIEAMSHGMQVTQERHQGVEEAFPWSPAPPWRPRSQPRKVL
jgi:hypothetical protein